MRIHPVFHTSLLSPFTTDSIKGRHIDLPPPVVTDEGVEELEVQDIRASRIVTQGGRRKLQYLIRYLGRPGEDSWENAEENLNMPEVVEQFYKRNPGALSETDIARYRPTTRRARGGNVMS